MMVISLEVVSLWLNSFRFINSENILSFNLNTHLNQIMKSKDYPLRGLLKKAIPSDSNYHILILFAPNFHILIKFLLA